MTDFEAQVAVRLVMPVGASAPAPTVEIPHQDRKAFELSEQEKTEVAAARDEAQAEADTIEVARAQVARDAETGIAALLEKALAGTGQVTSVTIEEVREVV